MCHGSATAEKRHQQTAELLLLYESRPAGTLRLHGEEVVGVEQPSHSQSALPAE